MMWRLKEIGEGRGGSLRRARDRQGWQRHQSRHARKARHVAPRSDPVSARLGATRRAGEDDRAGVDARLHRRDGEDDRESGKPGGARLPARGIRGELRDLESHLRGTLRHDHAASEELRADPLPRDQGRRRHRPLRRADCGERTHAQLREIPREPQRDDGPGGRAQCLLAAHRPAGALDELRRADPRDAQRASATATCAPRSSRRTARRPSSRSTTGSTRSRTPAGTSRPTSS